MYRSGNKQFRGTLGAPGVRDPNKSSYLNSGNNLVMMHDKEMYMQEKQARNEAQLSYKRELEDQIAETRRRKEAERLRKRNEDAELKRHWNDPPPAASPTRHMPKLTTHHAPHDTKSALANVSFAPNQPISGDIPLPEVVIKPSLIDLHPTTAPLSLSSPVDTSEDSVLNSMFSGNGQDALTLQLERGTMRPAKPILTLGGPSIGDGLSEDEDKLLHAFSGVPSSHTFEGRTTFSAPTAHTPTPTVQRLGHEPLRVPDSQKLNLGLTQSSRSGGDVLGRHNTAPSGRPRHEGGQTQRPPVLPQTEAFLEGAGPNGVPTTEEPNLLQELSGLAETVPLVASRQVLQERPQEVSVREEYKGEREEEEELEGSSRLIPPQHNPPAPGNATVSEAEIKRARPTQPLPTWLEEESVAPPHPHPPPPPQPPVQKGGESYLRCTGSVFELLTEEDIRRGGGDLSVELVGEGGVLVETAPEYVVRALSSTSVQFDASIGDIFPRPAWLLSGDGKTYTCVLQPCPSFTTDVDVSVHVALPPALAYISNGPEASRLPSSAESFTIKSLETFGCI